MPRGKGAREAHPRAADAISNRRDIAEIGRADVHPQRPRVTVRARARVPPRGPSTCHPHPFHVSPFHVSQYALGLECLHEDLPQIKCELEFKNRRLQLRPALEEVRSAIYLGYLLNRPAAPAPPGARGGADVGSAIYLGDLPPSAIYFGNRRLWLRPALEEVRDVGSAIYVGDLPRLFTSATVGSSSARRDLGYLCGSSFIQRSIIGE